MPTVGNYQQGADMEANQQPQTTETVGGNQDQQHGVNGWLINGVWHQHGVDGLLIDGVWYQHGVEGWLINGRWHDRNQPGNPAAGWTCPVHGYQPGAYGPGADMEANQQPQTNGTVGGDQDQEPQVNETVGGDQDQQPQTNEAVGGNQDQQPQTNETVGGDQDQQHGVNGMLIDGEWYQHGWDGWLIDGVWYQYHAANLAAGRQPLNGFPNGTLIDSHSGTHWIVDDNGTIIYHSAYPGGIPSRVHTTGSVGEEVHPGIILGQGPGPRDTECPICRVDVEANDWTLTHTGCNTTFHRDCLDDWAHQNNADDVVITCPQCRAVLVPAVEPPFAVVVEDDDEAEDTDPFTMVFVESDEDDGESEEGYDPSWYSTYTMEAEGPNRHQPAPLSRFFGRNYRQNWPHHDFSNLGPNFYDDEAENKDDNGSGEDSDDDGFDHDNDDKGSDHDNGDKESDHDNDDNGSDQANDDKGSGQANDNNNEAADRDPR